EGNCGCGTPHARIVRGLGMSKDQRQRAEKSLIQRRNVLDALGGHHCLYFPRSSRNSDAGVTLVIKRWSRARVHATYSRLRSVLYTSARSASSVIASIRDCRGTISSSHAITATPRNSRPLARCIAVMET